MEFTCCGFYYTVQTQSCSFVCRDKMVLMRVVGFRFSFLLLSEDTIKCWQCVSQERAGHRSPCGQAFNGGLHRLATDFQPHCLSWNDFMTTLGKCLNIEERPESWKIRDVVPSLKASVPQTKWCMCSAPDLHANKLHFQSELWLWPGGDTHYTLFISFFNVLQLFFFL